MKSIILEIELLLDEYKMTGDKSRIDNVLEEIDSYFEKNSCLGHDGYAKCRRCGKSLTPQKE